jgi:hypothetical protein
MVLDDLVSVIDRLVETDPTELADARAVVVIERELARLGAVAARNAAAFDAGGTWRADGARSAGHWLAHSANLPIGKAHRRMTLGAALAELPLTAKAWLAGDIGEAHVGSIVHARKTDSKAMARDEEIVIEWARHESFNGFLRGLKYWTYEADPDFADGAAARLRSRRELSSARRPNGLVCGHFTLDQVGGEIFSNELARIEEEFFAADWAAAQRRRDAGEADAAPARTAAQRRADALVEMAIRSSTAPAVGRRPEPLFSVFVGWESFHGMLCRLGRGAAIEPGELTPWLDVAWVERVVFDGPSRVIDVGAQRRFFTGATRRAVELRDQECFHEFCEVPAADAQIDHIQPYSAGGGTVVDNGRVACGPHNRARHKRRQ